MHPKTMSKLPYPDAPLLLGRQHDVERVGVADDPGRVFPEDHELEDQVEVLQKSSLYVIIRAL